MATHEDYLGKPETYEPIPEPQPGDMMDQVKERAEAALAKVKEAQEIDCLEDDDSLRGMADALEYVLGHCTELFGKVFCEYYQMAEPEIEKKGT